MVKKNKTNDRIIRAELIFTPLLILLPFIVGVSLIYDWINRDFLTNQLELTAELIIGIVIIIVNLMFDIPFLNSLKEAIEKK
jgi:hypothetical protein